MNVSWTLGLQALDGKYIVCMSKKAEAKVPKHLEGLLENCDPLNPAGKCVLAWLIADNADMFASADSRAHYAVSPWRSNIRTSQG